MAAITIKEDTPLYGVTNLLNHIQKNRLDGSDWYIAENPSSGYIYACSEDYPYTLIGNDEEVYRFFYLPYGGEEFGEHDFADVDYDELHRENQEAYLDILREIDSDESLELLEQLEAEILASEAETEEV